MGIKRALNDLVHEVPAQAEPTPATVTEQTYTGPALEWMPVTKVARTQVVRVTRENLMDLLAWYAARVRAKYPDEAAPRVSMEIEEQPRWSQRYGTPEHAWVGRVEGRYRKLNLVEGRTYDEDGSEITVVQDGTADGEWHYDG